MLPELCYHLGAVLEIEAAISGPDDHALFDLYTEFVRGVTGLADAVVIPYESHGVGEPGSYVEESTLVLCKGDFETPKPDDVLGWLCDIHSTVWHEIGHLEHSDRLANVMLDVELQNIASEDLRLATALNALEDTRQERATIQRHGAAAHAWLRHNINRGGGWMSRARFTAAQCSWPVAAAVYAARGTSGVLSPDELQAFVALDVMAGVAVDAQQPLWKQFAVLRDEDLRDGGSTDACAVGLIHQLAHLL